MRIALFIIFIFISLASLGQIQHEKLIGSWSNCKDDGTYNEIHFQREYLVEAIGSEDGYLGNFWFTYKLSYDTLHYAESPLDNLYENDRLRKLKIYYLDENLLVIESLSVPEIDTLYRLEIDFIPQPVSKSIEIAQKWEREFENRFESRMEKVNCVDQRPPNERKGNLRKGYLLNKFK